MKGGRTLADWPGDVKNKMPATPLSRSRRFGLGLCGKWHIFWMMTVTEQEILDTLVELDRQVKAMPQSNPKPSLLPLFNRLEELSRQLPRQTAPELVHYLTRKSYEKARLFLEGRDAENAAGNCGH